MSDTFDLNEEFRFALREAAHLLARFWIRRDEWVLVGPNVNIIRGCKVPYTRTRHFHVMIEPKVVPWKMTDLERISHEVVASTNTEFGLAFQAYIKKTNFDFDFILSPHPITFFIPDRVDRVDIGDGVIFNLLHILDNIDIEDYVFENFPPEKVARILHVYETVIHYAQKHGDRMLEVRVQAFLKKYTTLVASIEGEAEKIKKSFLATGTLRGTSGFAGCVKGEAVIIENIDEVPNNIGAGKIIITKMSSSKTLPLIIMSKGLVTDEGGTLCHAAIISREYKIPCILGAKIATQVFKDGDLVEVDAGQGVITKLRR